MKLGMLTLVMLSVTDRPVSLASVRFGVEGAPSAPSKMSPWTANVFTVSVLMPAPPALGPSTITALTPEGAPVTVRKVLMSPSVPAAAPSCFRKAAVLPVV